MFLVLVLALASALTGGSFQVDGVEFSLRFVQGRAAIFQGDRLIYRGGAGSYYARAFSCGGTLHFLELRYQGNMYSLLVDRRPYLSSQEELYSPRALCLEGGRVLSVGVKDRMAVFMGGREYWIKPLFGPQINPKFKVKDGELLLELEEVFAGMLLKREVLLPPPPNPGIKTFPLRVPSHPFWFNYQLAPNKYIAFGDSITYGCGYGTCQHDPPIGYPPRLEKLLNKRIGPSQVVNRGVPGEETREGILRINRVLEEEQARYLLLNEGTNDVVHAEYPLSVTEENLRGLIERSLRFGTYVVLSTIIPRKDWFWYAPYFHNKLLSIVKLQRKFARKYSLPLADFFKAFTSNPNWKDELLSEGNHPSRKGYQLMAEVWEQAIETIAPYPPHSLSVVHGGGKIYLQWEGGGEADLTGFLLCRQGVCLDLGLRFSWNLHPMDLQPLEVVSYDRAGNRSQPLRIEFSEEE